MVVEIGLLVNLLRKTDDFAVGRADDLRQRKIAGWAEFKLNMLRLVLLEVISVSARRSTMQIEFCSEIGTLLRHFEMIAL
jgi:hypothetical protein